MNESFTGTLPGAGLLLVWWMLFLIVPLTIGLHVTREQEQRSDRESAVDAREAQLNWIAIEARFQQSPRAGVSAADVFLARLVRSRRDDIGLLEEYHIARAIARKEKTAGASADELNAAMQTYRMLVRRLGASSLRPL